MEFGKRSRASLEPDSALYVVMNITYAALMSLKLEQSNIIGQIAIRYHFEKRLGVPRHGGLKQKLWLLPFGLEQIKQDWRFQYKSNRAI